MPSKKKIILTGSIPPPYHGSSIFFSSLLNSRIKDEFDISHLDISDHRDLDNLSRLDLTNVKLAFSNIISLYKMLKKTDYDLVYIPVASNFLPYLRDGLFILTASYFSKSKIVIHLHEGDYFRFGFYEKAVFPVKYFIRKSLSRVDTAIVLGENLKPVFEGLVKNIEICQNGIRKDNITGKDHKKNSGKRNIAVSYLGNLFESKGVIDILNAAEIVLRKHNDVNFRFAGAWSQKEGKTKEIADKIVEDKSLGDHVEFTGIITGKAKDDFLDRTDIFVFPTWYRHEGFPLVIIEAMAASCPVISTKETGAIPDIVAEGETGLLIDKKRPDLIAEAIIKLIEYPEKRKEMGEKGMERYEKFFTLDTCIERMIGVFNKVLN
ncbi:MAG TPA: glycosyltransferase family 4 protein [Ignavibacteria bacterium]|nr:glycosyltransferase family 4 protein [Ignavibacteria bacterium]